MELRVIEYFLAVAREQSITKASEALHITQPTLSRQLSDLEKEFGKQLFIRGKRKVTLTDDGILFRKKAEEISILARRTEAMMKSSDSVSGDIYIGCGETDAMQHIARVANKIQKQYGDIHFHIISGDTSDLTDRLDKGLFDFCLLIGEVDKSKYDYLELPYKDVWGVLFSKSSELSEKEHITAEDLWDKPLIASRQMLDAPSFERWMKKEPSELNISATYNLAYNASLMAKENMGYVLTLDRLINTKGTDLCFKELYPKQTENMLLVWKKHQKQSKATELFLKALGEYIQTLG